MNISALFGLGYYDAAYSGGSDTEINALLSMSVFIFLVVIAAYVFEAYFMGRIFAKAGIPAWKAWVPIYNNWTMLELGGQQGFWAVLALIPFVNLVSVVFMYLAMYTIGLKLGKQGTFILFAIFLPLVWLIWLAIDSSTWEGKPAHPHKKATA
jgi:hypothetical protein